MFVFKAKGVLTKPSHASVCRMFCFLIVTLGPPAFAQKDEGALERRRIEERQLRLNEQLQVRPDVRLTLPSMASDADALPQETPCFDLSRLEINHLDGQPLHGFDWLTQDITLTSLGAVEGEMPCVGARGVAWLIERLQKALIDRGYVTSRLLVTPQDMSQGVLRLTLILGRIREIRPSEPFDYSEKILNALPVRKGDVLNLRDIEQTLENLKRVPTAEADIQIQPSQAEGEAIGESDLLVTYRAGFPIRLTVTADDSGTQSTGKFQQSITVSYDNPLQLNDLFYVTNSNDMGGGDVGTRGNHATTAHYSIAIGHLLWSFTGSSSSYHQSVKGLNGPVNYRGISENNEFKLTRTLMRDANQKIGVSIKAFQRKSNNFIDDTEVLPQRRVVGGWDGTLNWKQFIHEAILDSSFTYRRGTGAFGAIPAPGTAFGEESAYFEMMTAEANLSWPMRWGAQRLRYNGTWRIQANQTPLTPQDRFAIGGRYTVRGYDGEAVLSAERGWLLRNDLSLPLAESNQELYFGLDHGEVSGKSSDLLVGKRLTGAVMGLRGVMQKINYDVFVGGPVEKPDQFTTAGSTAGFSLSASF